MLQQSLQTTNDPDSLSTGATMLDLLNLIIPLLDAATSKSFFALAISESNNMLDNSDSSIQKKTYRALASVVVHHGDSVFSNGTDIDETLGRLEANAGKVSSGAKPVRTCSSSRAIFLIPLL